jgi:hypothetical protein
MKNMEMKNKIKNQKDYAIEALKKPKSKVRCYFYNAS